MYSKSFDEYGRVRVRINGFANQEAIDNARMEYKAKNNPLFKTLNKTLKMEDIYNYTIEASSKSRPSVNESLGVVLK